MTERLVNAAVATMTELEAEMARTSHLALELRRAKARVEDLKALCHRMNGLVEGFAHTAVRDRLATILASGAHAHAKAAASRPAAVDAFLAKHRGEEITPKELEKALRAEGFAVPDQRYAARALARKAAQGVVKRVGRGLYLIQRNI